MPLAITLPQLLMPVGPGSVQSNTIDSSSSRIVATLQFVGWPNAKDKALDYVLLYSNDNGATWLNLSLGDIDDSVSSANVTVTLGCSLPGVGSSTRKIRLNYNFAKALTISGTVSVS